MKKVAVKKYEIDRNFLNCHIAGFQYYDGCQVIDELKVGTPLEIFAETDNPHDSFAVVVYFGEKKLGYIPKDKNELLSKLLQLGHADILNVFINFKNLDLHPEQQFRIAVKIKDGR
ncbi:restriction endonuclease [Bacteroidia bacterium]|nr:restriction endonuclease [Bacteroidia bacterium]